MNIRVITPPAPILVPSDVPGSHAANDPALAALIAAATEMFDGYTGTLGRCLGPQLIEWSTRLRCDRTSLPIGPVLEVVSVVTETEAGQQTPQDSSTYRLLDGRLFVADAAWLGQPLHRVRYWAGYGERDDDDEWIANVPERVRQAIKLTVQHLMSMGAESLFVSIEEVEGVGRTQYTISDRASDLIKTTCDRLVSGLQVSRL